jgi:hypothetical protein
VNALDVITDARDLLELTSYPVHIADTLETDANGLLAVPDDPSQYVLHTILGTPEHQWGTTRFGTVRIQVNAFSVVEGEALAMLAAAEPLLVAAKFIPLALESLGRDGPYTGYAQAFERNTE